MFDDPFGYEPAEQPETAETADNQAGSAADECAPPGGSPTPPELDVDTLIANALAALQPGMALAAVEETLRTLSTHLVNVNASMLVLNGAYQRVKGRLKALKLPAMPRADWDLFVKDARATAALAQSTTAASSAAAALVPLHTVLPDAPVPAAAVLPAGWLLGPGGLQKVGPHHNLPVCPMPLVITRFLVNGTDNAVVVELAWRRNGCWKKQVVPRSDIAAKNKIVRLADYGVAVTTNNADDLIEFLAQFETANAAALPQVEVRRQLGWVDDSLTQFLCGRTLLTGATAAAPDPTDLEPDDPFGAPLPAAAAGAPCQAVYFQGGDDGDEQIADGFHACGTFAEWRTAVMPALVYPKVRLVMLAGLAAPLLTVLGAKNFIVDLCGPSSKGKTMTLRLAASCWGNPDEQASNGCLAIWNASRVWIERGAAVLHNLPLLLDDTKVARDKEDIPKVLYDIASGRGRGRGTTKGTERAQTWSTVLITSGEAPATSYSQDGGTRARVVTVWGLPFDSANEQTGKLVEAMRTGVLTHYGHAGPRLITYILERRDQWATWKHWQQCFRDHYARKARGNSVGMRLADALAVVTVTGLIAAKALDLPLLRRSPVKPLWRALATAAAEADRTEQALRHVVEWACGHQDQFCGRRLQRMGRPPTGWAGRWDGDCEPGETVPGGAPKEPWEFLGFLPSALRQLLKDGGFEYEAVVQGWKDRRWLKVDASDKSGLHYQAKLDGEKPRLVAIRRDIIARETGVTEVAAQLPEGGPASSSGGFGDGDDRS